jgi:ABC-type dipeptide/oligopeptide/nickel transport system permease subunit
MRLAGSSGRTKLIYGVFMAVFAIGLGLILALIVGFTGAWFDEKVPQISALIVYVAIVMLVLRLALAWSMRADRR